MASNFLYRRFEAVVPPDVITFLRWIQSRSGLGDVEEVGQVMELRAVREELTLFLPFFHFRIGFVFLVVVVVFYEFVCVRLKKSFEVVVAKVVFGRPVGNRAFNDKRLSE